MAEPRDEVKLFGLVLLTVLTLIVWLLSGCSASEPGQSKR